MTIKSILVQAGSETAASKSAHVEYAFRLASRFDANLTALVHQIDVVLPRSAYGKGITTQAKIALADEHSEAREQAAWLQAKAEELGVKAEVLTERSFAYTIPEEVANHARLHDLSIMSVDREGLLSQHAIAEYVLFHSGRPLLVVPPHASGFTLATVVIAWDYSRVAARAMAEALPLLREAGEVIVATFGDDKAMDSSLSPNDVIASLARRGVQARFVRAQRHDSAIAAAINDFCTEQKAGLLVMGGYGHSRFREFILGGATRGILEAPAVPTLLSH